MDNSVIFLEHQEASSDKDTKDIKGENGRWSKVTIRQGEASLTTKVVIT